MSSPTNGSSATSGGDGSNSNGTPLTRPQIVGRKSNPLDLLKSLKSVDKKNQKKPTILDQAAQDWRRAKVEDDIVDELKQATKSKTSYVDKQRFLAQTDLKQFEREKDIRDKIRSRQAAPK